MKYNYITEYMSYIIRTALMMLLLLSLHTSCSTNQLVEDIQFTAETYPLRFSAVLSEASYSRSAKTGFGDADVIGISFFEKESKYIAKTAVPVTDNPILYWETSDSSTVKAWYPAESKVYDISDQKSGSIDFLYAEKKIGFETESKIETLDFKHHMAWVVCSINDEDNILGGNLSVKFNGVSEVKLDKMNLTPTGYGNVNPFKDDDNVYSAILYPEQMKGKDFIVIQGESGEAVYRSMNDELTNLKAGHKYIYSITIFKDSLVVECMQENSGNWGLGQIYYKEAVELNNNNM